MVAIPEVEGWPQLLATVAGEILERMRAVAELSRLTEMSFQLERQAALGRYMVEARHNLNNALTSILGNCDLILLDDEQLPSATKRQVETIRNMGMRLNEIMQRFSSLQKEMLLVEQQSESSIKARAIAAGV
jgi:signal transduction histidine kinase